jgi:hypothetical protein
MSKHLDAKFDLPISEKEELLKKIRSYLRLAKFLFYVNVTAFTGIVIMLVWATNMYGPLENCKSRSRDDEKHW